MSTQKEKDLLLGELGERQIKLLLTIHFNLLSLEKLDKYHPMDYRSDDIYYEIKTRRVNHNHYPTTMIGENKIKWLQQNKVKLAYFVFVFDDGNYYYKYDQTKKFNIQIGGRYDRGISEFKRYAFISIDELIKF